MEPLLNLPRDQFLAALAELQLDPERRDDLVRQYRRDNSPFAPIYGLLERTAAEDAGEGMQRASMLPVARPEGMSVAEAVRAGEAQFAVPQGLLEAFGGVAQAVDAPAAAGQGLIPADDMVAEALNVGGVAQLGGAAMPAPRGALRSGAMRSADDVAETPAQQVARLLREGRADDVTDDLMAQADPQEMYQLYVSGDTGMDLPMDEASRMARAAEMGLTQDVYKGMNAYTGGPIYRSTSRGMELELDRPWSEITQINAPNQTYLPVNMAGFTSDNPRVAARFQDWLRERGAVFPMRLNPDRMVEVDFENRPAASGQFEAFAHQPTYNAVMDAAADISNAGIIMRNTADEANVFVPRNPNQLRSRFARFDPRLSHLSNLSAANIDPLTGAAAMGASQQQQDPLANLRAYLDAYGGLLGR